MNILGLSCYYHDSAATLVQNGKIIAACEEERFSRKKHDRSFPQESINFCLKKARISFKDIDAVFFYEKPLLKMERLLRTAAEYPLKSEKNFQKNLSHLVDEELCLKDTLKKKYDYSGDIHFLEHHISHAASGFYISNFKEASILTVDGVGEFATTSLFRADDEGLHKLEEIHYPHSLGLLYSTVTSFLGFKVNNDEYKVMGLASFGKPTFYNQLKKLIHIFDDGSFELDLNYFSYMYDDHSMYSDKFISTFGNPRIPESEICENHQNLACSVQKICEEVMIQLATRLYKLNPSPNLCLAGGVALNGVCNWKIFENTPFTNICIQPASGDSGASMGAALHGYHLLTAQRPSVSLHTSLLGPDYSNEEIKKYLDEQNATYQFLEEETLCQKTAQLIFQNFIIGWHQGPMEFGPRALGNRSILANPCNPDMKDILNSRVKFREDFRPFAPAVLKEKASHFFEIKSDSPFMLLVLPVKNGQKDKIPSVTHIDNSARVQTVDAKHNKLFYKLIQEFEKLNDVPILINTSFNIRGEPIVCSPQDAYKCFLKTDIDYLVIGNFLVKKF